MSRQKVLLLAALLGMGLAIALAGCRDGDRDALCGNGVLDAREECDGRELGICDEGQACDASCRCGPFPSLPTLPPPACGDGICDPAEAGCGVCPDDCPPC